MKHKEKLLLAINVITELAEELVIRKQEELDGGYADDTVTLRANIQAENKAIKTVWHNADLLKKLLG